MIVETAESRVGFIGGMNQKAPHMRGEVACGQRAWERMDPFSALGPDVPSHGGLVAAFRYENGFKLGCNVRWRCNDR